MLIGVTMTERVQFYHAIPWQETVSSIAPRHSKGEWDHTTTLNNRRHRQVPTGMKSTTRKIRPWRGRDKIIETYPREISHRGEVVDAGRKSLDCNMWFISLLGETSKVIIWIFYRGSTGFVSSGNVNKAYKSTQNAQYSTLLGTTYHPILPWYWHRIFQLLTCT